MTDFAEASEDSEVYKISKDDFFIFLKKYPKIAFNTVKELSQKLNEADNRIRDLALNSAIVRAINELIRLGKKFGIKKDGYIEINTRITHEEFAEMIGTSRETSSRILKRLSKLSFIRFGKNKHILVNSEKIREQV